MPMREQQPFHELDHRLLAAEAAVFIMNNADVHDLSGNRAGTAHELNTPRSTPRGTAK